MDLNSYPIKAVFQKNIMLKLILTILLFGYTHALCSVSHEELWNCLLQKKCINVYKLHSMSMQKHKRSIQRPYIMAIEGPKYRRLFEDCDANNDGCLDLKDIKIAGDKCQRSCMWRKTMKSMMCPP